MMRIQAISDFSCRPTARIREILARFNDLSHPLHVVTDENGRLVGTLTDGDIRRALLRGASLDDPVAAAVHGNAIFGRVGEDPANATLLRSVPFLPLLDEQGAVVEILVKQRSASMIASALVMAGGLGERLGQRTRSVPKPLLPVGGKPILEHIVQRLEDINVSDIYVSVHYLADKIEAYVAGRNNRSNVHVIHESQRLGTAGAIAAVPASQDEPLLVINGDVMTQIDFVAMAEFHQLHGYDATLAVARYEIEVPFGVVRSDENGLFAGIDEKPAYHHFVAAGIYYLAPQIRALAPLNRPIDMPELLNLGRSIGLRIGLFPIHEYWIDVGRPHDLEAAERDHAVEPGTPKAAKASPEA